MAVQQKQDHRRLIKEYNVHFDGPIDREKWPSAHFHTFSNIQKLGRTEFAEYRESVTIDSEDTPWREQTRFRAERIATLAKICREGRKSEAACRRCRARLWRSELEATTSAFDQFSESLEERQKRRLLCTCRAGRRGLDTIEQGVNLLFDDRAQEAIVQEASLQSVMQKKEEPDRVYGLRMTKRLERLLQWTEDKRPTSGGKMIGESIRSTPFRPDGEPIVFPFLALEAKSEKGSDNFSDIETQTAFTIRLLLSLQEDLKTASGKDSEWESGPLVWFLANKGEQWRVAAAYIEYLNGVRHHRIIDLWDGRITSSDGALQLLLIVDYVFDWARDIYREAIICELRHLAANNTTSLGNDSDVFSLEDRVAFWPQLPQVSELSSDEEEDTTKLKNSAGADIQDPLRAFDSPYGVLRDARYIRSRFITLYITEDNLSVLMESMKTPEKARRAAENILQYLKDSFGVTREALDSLDLQWTGKDRENMILYSPEKVFLVNITVSAYLSPDWEQTRELCCLAVAEGVVEELFRYSNLKNNQSWVSSRFPWVEESVFVSGFEVYLSMGIKDDLIAAISRACVSTKLFTENENTKKNQGREQGTWWITSAEKISGDMEYRFDAAIMPDNHAYARGFVSQIYNLHKIGRNEPSSSILRISSRVDQQMRPDKTAMRSMWPGLDLSAALRDQEQHIIFVTSKNPSNVTQYAEFCLFLTDVSRMNTFIDSDKLEQENTTCKLQAMRMDTKQGWGGGWNKADMFIHDADFQENKKKLLGHLAELESFAKYRKGKGVDGAVPEKLWRPKKTHENWTLSNAEAQSYPESYPQVLQFRNMLANEGRRVTSITSRQRVHSRPELVKLAGLEHLDTNQNGDSTQSSSSTTGDALPIQSQRRTNLIPPGTVNRSQTRKLH